MQRDSPTSEYKIGGAFLNNPPPEQTKVERGSACPMFNDDARVRKAKVVLPGG